MHAQMAQAFTQRNVHAWIQNGMHTQELTQEFMRILIHTPEAESRVAPKSTSSRLTSKIVSTREKLIPKLQTDSGSNPIWILKWFTRTAEPIRPDIFSYFSETALGKYI